MQMVRKPRKPNLPKIIETSVRENRHIGQPLAAIYPEVSDHLIGVLLAGQKEKIAAARELEAHILRLNLALAKATGHSAENFRRQTAVTILERLCEDAELAGKNAKDFPGVSAKHLQFYTSNLPGEIARLKQLGEDGLIQLPEYLLRDALIMHQARLKAVMGAQYGPYIKTLNKSVALATRKLNA